MKRKEMKQLAKKIAAAEKNIEQGIDVEASKDLIFRLTSQADWQDLDTIDEMIQEILQES